MPELERQFNHLANSLNVQRQVERNIIILRVIANNVFPSVFNKQWIDDFISEDKSIPTDNSALGSEREKVSQLSSQLCVLEQHLLDQGYSCESLKQKNWM